jgi:hypothetical protein
MFWLLSPFWLSWIVYSGRGFERVAPPLVSSARGGASIPFAHGSV